MVAGFASSFFIFPELISWLFFYIWIRFIEHLKVTKEAIGTVHRLKRSNFNYRFLLDKGDIRKTCHFHQFVRSPISFKRWYPNTRWITLESINVDCSWYGRFIPCLVRAIWDLVGQVGASKLHPHLIVGELHFPILYRNQLNQVLKAIEQC